MYTLTAYTHELFFFSINLLLITFHLNFAPLSQTQSRRPRLCREEILRIPHNLGSLIVILGTVWLLKKKWNYFTAARWKSEIARGSRACCLHYSTDANLLSSFDSSLIITCRKEITYVSLELWSSGINLLPSCLVVQMYPSATSHQGLLSLPSLRGR